MSNIYPTLWSIMLIQYYTIEMIVRKHSGTEREWAGCFPSIDTSSHTISTKYCDLSAVLCYLCSRCGPGRPRIILRSREAGYADCGPNEKHGHRDRTCSGR